MFTTALFPLDDLLTAWWKDTFTHSLLLLIMVALLGLLGWRLLKRREEHISSPHKEDSGPPDDG